MKISNVKIFALMLALLCLVASVACARQDPMQDGEQEEPVGQNAIPTVADFDPTKSYSLTDYATLAMEEYVKLGRYRGLTLTLDQKTFAVTDEALDEAIKAILKANHPDIKVTDRAVEWGDTVIVSYVGKKDGVAFSGGTAHDQVIEVVEPNGYIPGFIEGLVGVVPGVPTDAPMTFPDNYGATELAGEDVVFTFTVSYIEVIPELSDDFVAQYTKGEYQSAHDYREALRADMQSDAYDQQLKEELWSTVIENAAVKKYPVDAVMYYYSNMYSTYSYYAAVNGLTYEQYLSYMGARPQDLFDACLYKVKQDMVYQAVIEKGDYTYTQEQYEQMLEDYTDEMREGLNEMLVANGVKALTQEEAKAYFDTNYRSDILKELLISIAAEDLLADATVNVTGSEGSAS